ncbi:hypothetical protein B0H63DRAFT_523794 [Podospora didyma]|uniref:F-box domain-containing protein n=1 Tax=Podospora didyma TaxID=330526 RepID=A0AAE0NGE9_9PEZI|nr:hypothetical protein B0H63DRAFT_523794 [Podospora didyma]
MAFLSVQPSLFGVPNEILLEICSGLLNERDLSALSVTCRRIHRVADVCPYDGFPDRAMRWGAEHGLLNTMQKALAQGADVNFCAPVFGTPLHGAAWGSAPAESLYRRFGKGKWPGTLFTSPCVTAMQRRDKYAVIGHAIKAEPLNDYYQLDSKY